jgi:hypothetical protein
MQQRLESVVHYLTPKQEGLQQQCLQQPACSLQPPQRNAVGNMSIAPHWHHTAAAPHQHVAHQHATHQYKIASMLLLVL